MMKLFHGKGGDTISKRLRTVQSWTVLKKLYEIFLEIFFLVFIKICVYNISI